MRRVALYEAIKTGRRMEPPHLRASSRGKACASCRYFKAKVGRAGVCRLYGGWPVAPGDVCDSYRGD
jgi:hypothetical protein